MRAIGPLVVATVLLAACVYPPTEVIVALDTDIPIARTARITVTAQNATMVAPDTDAQLTYTRGGASPTITLPQSFAIVPAPGQARDAQVTLLVRADIAAGAHGEPAQTLLRRARFRFAPRTPQRLPIFLAASCITPSVGCTTVPDAECTAGTRCEERGLTCGDRGTCVAIDVQLAPLDAGLDAAMDLVSDVSPDLPIDAAMDNQADGSDGGACMTVSACGPACVACAPVANATVTCDGTRCGFTCDSGFVLVSGSCVPPPGPPRQIAPISTMRVTTQSPTLAWRNPTGLTDALVEVCSDRAMQTACRRSSVTGTSSAVTPALAPGPWFWRVRGMVNGMMITPVSPTWEFFVGRVDAPAGRLPPVPDFNGDGLADVVVGEDCAPPSCSGAVRIYLGQRGAAPTDATLAATLTGPDGVSMQFGQFVGGAGDLNGDGFGDLVVGSPQYTSGIGRAYIYLGGPSGIATGAAPSAMLTGVDPPGPPDGFGAGFGSTCAGLGDLNGDGYGDLAVSAIGTTTIPGHVYLFQGGPTGIVNGAPATARLSAPSMGGRFFGAAVALGDENADGFDDLAVLAPEGGAASTGLVCLYRGSAIGIANEAPPVAVLSVPAINPGTALSIAAGSDANRDGRADVIVGAACDGPAGCQGRAFVFLSVAGGLAAGQTLVLLSSPNGGRFGSAVAMGGDLDGDGYDDVLIGAPDYAGSAGGAIPYYGADLMLGRTPFALLSSPGGPNAHFGVAVAIGGDFDGDGFADGVIGGDGQVGVSVAGHAWVFRGTNSGVAATPDSTLSGSGSTTGSYGATVASGTRDPRLRARRATRCPVSARAARASSARLDPPTTSPSPSPIR